SISELRNDKNRLVTQQEYESWEKEFHERFFDIANQLKPYSSFGSNPFTELDNISLTLGEITGRNIKDVNTAINLLRKNGFDNVPAEIANQLVELSRDFRQSPTEYFEAKPVRK